MNNSINIKAKKIIKKRKIDASDQTNNRKKRATIGKGYLETLKEEVDDLRKKNKLLLEENKGKKEQIRFLNVVREDGLELYYLYQDLDQEVGELRHEKKKIFVYIRGLLKKNKHLKEENERLHLRIATAVTPGRQ